MGSSLWKGGGGNLEERHPIRLLFSKPVRPSLAQSDFLYMIARIAYPGEGHWADRSRNRLAQGRVIHEGGSIFASSSL